MAGTITGTTINHGITIGTTGAYSSPLTITSTGAVVASVNTDAIFGTISSPTIINAGTVKATGSGSGIDLTSGGSVGNTGLITGFNGVYIKGAAGYVTNSDTIIGTGTAGAGVYLFSGGTVTNNAGLIQGYTGVDLHGFGTVTNLGSIDATGLYGVHLLAGGTVVNSGRITNAHDNKYTVALYEVTGGGYVTNSQSGYIGPGGVGITRDVGTVINAGTIKDTYRLVGYGAGVKIGNGGSVSNAASGLIEGTYYGVNIAGAAGTVTNSGTIIATGTTAGAGVNLVAGGTVTDSGTITGGSGTAINFAAGSNLLVLDPGYKLTGVVYGAIGATNTLELGSTASAGTLSSVLATEFVNFGTVKVDPGAQWTLTGSSSLAGLTLTDLGTLTNTGSLSGAGTFVVDPATLFNSGSIGLTVTLSGGGLVDNELGGTIAVAGTAVFGTLAAATILNAGTIESTGATSGTGIYFALGGVVTNRTSGLITQLGTASGNAIDIAGSAGTIVNYGTISSTGTSAAILLAAGGVITNGPSGSTTALIQAGSAGNAVKIAAPGTLVNFGTIDITGTGNAVYLKGGTLTNSGTIESATGSAITIKGTVAGTIGNSGLIENLTTAHSAIYIQAGGLVTNAQGGTISSGRSAIAFNNTSGSPVSFGTVSNSGTIESTGTATGSGVYLGQGGIVTNQTSGLITANLTGVKIVGSAGTVTNFGTIESTGTATGNGIYLGQGGIVTNQTSGLITANLTPVQIKGSAGTVTNFGTIEITGTGTALNLAAGGTVTNFGTILANTGTNGIGVNLAAGGTVIDSGTIHGSATAINFGVAGSDLLVLEGPFYTLYGTITGVGSADTLELLGTAGPVTVKFNEPSAGFTNFGTVAFGAPSGNSETLKISDTTTLPGTISGFTLTHEIVDLTQLSPVSAHATLNGSDQLVVSNGSQSVSLQLDPSGTYTGVVWVTGTDSSTGTDISVACFCRGTLILTERGEVAVEDLAIGDRVITLSGAPQPIKWIGRRVYDGRFVGSNRAVLPIRFEAGALADGIPARDLWVSPEHSFYIDGVLAQAKHLINGATIVQAESVEQVEYFHIELADHDVILAEGAPAETFVDCDNRFIFHNRAEYALLYPDDDAPVWQFCAPRLEWGSEELAAIRAALLARAEALGRITGDPDLHLIADGEVVRGQSVADRVWRFALPAGTSTLAIASRSMVPAAAEASSTDERALGVAIERIVLGGAGLRIEVGHDCPALGAGFHADEGSHRWTDGLGRLPEELLRPLTGDSTVEIQLAEMALHYRCEAPAPAPPVAPRRAARAALRALEPYPV